MPLLLPLQGSMFVSLCMPRVEACDLRPEVPQEQSLVISSGHKASFLMLEVGTGRWWLGIVVEASTFNLLTRPLVCVTSFGCSGLLQWAWPTSS